jgi:hypothetical protein
MGICEHCVSHFDSVVALQNIRQMGLSATMEGVGAVGRLASSSATLPPHMPPNSPSTWTIHQEVFENDPAFAPSKRAASLAAGKLPVRQHLIRFDAHQLVLRAAVRAIERRCFGDWHGGGEGLTPTIYFTGGRSANVGGVTVDR